MRTSDRAWLALAAGIIAYDLAAAEDETLSACAQRHPMVTAAFVEVIGAHLSRRWPIDPLALAFAALRHLLRQTGRKHTRKYTGVTGHYTAARGLTNLPAASATDRTSAAATAV